MSKIDEERLGAMNDALEVMNLFIAGHIHVNHGKTPAVIFDIDDTLIDSMTRENIMPMILLYKSILKMNIPIFLITARPREFIGETHNELRQHGINNYKELFMVGHDLRTITGYPDSYIEDKSMRKAKARKYIENKGYDILLNIGDDPGDMMHGHFMYGVKLPYLY